MSPRTSLPTRLALALCAALVACGVDPTTEPEAAHDGTAGTGVELSLDRAAVLSEYLAEDGAWLSPVVEVPTGATRVAALATLDAPLAGALVIEARGFDAEGMPGAWRPLLVTWEEELHFVAVAELDERVNAVELRIGDGVAARLAHLTWSASIPEAAIPPSEPFEQEIGAARELLRAELSAVGVRSRADWGARPTRCTTRDTAKSRMAIHHTVTAAMGDPAALIRGIQAYHMDGRGYCDVGYHFLVTLDGTVWEARPLDMLGAHTGGQNTGNIGVSFVGCFHTSSCGAYPPNVPPDEMVAGAGAVVRKLAELYGIAISASTVKGHRDHSGQSTACPGDHLHARLDTIRAGGPPPLPPFAAEYVAQTFPLARDPFELEPGEIVSGYLEMRNVGSETWRPGSTKLGTTEPRDGASPLAAPDWLSENRPATIDREVPPGETGRFAFSVRAPETPGDYPQYLSLVEEGVAWFATPPDDQLQIRVTVVPGDALPDPASTDAGPEVEGSDGGAARAFDASLGESRIEGSCGVVPPTAGSARLEGFALAISVLALSIAGRQRRRRRAP